jgi:hypothetical protein
MAWIAEPCPVSAVFVFAGRMSDQGILFAPASIRPMAGKR